MSPLRHDPNLWVQEYKPEAEKFSANPLIQEIRTVLDQIGAFKERAKLFYFEVILSAVRCPACNGRLRMTGQSECACSCGKTWDPTVEFQKSACCSAKLRQKTFHYACSKCHKVVPSRFLFDERVFDRGYFRVMMQESRNKAKARREEFKRLLAGLRSDTYCLSETPDLESVPGLLDDLDLFIKEERDGPDEFSFDLDQPFNMDRYREHILSALSWSSIRFSAIGPFIEDHRKDRIWRFVTLVFMAHDHEVDIEQVGNELFIQRHYNEAHA